MSDIKRILYLEDDPLDFELVQAALLAAGVKSALTRVETQDDYLAELAAGGWDLVFSDHTLQGFNGDWALARAREMAPETPFVFISGRMGEETAIDSLKHGATDYVLKHALARLAPAVDRALREAAERAERRRAEAALKTSEALHRQIMESSPDMCFVLDRQERCLYANPQAAAALKRTAEEIAGRTLAEVFPAQAAARYSAALEHLLRTGEAYQREELLEMPRGRIWAETRLLPVRNAQGSVETVVGIVRDITERKRAEDDRRNWESRLQQSQKLESLGVMAGGVAHDFNNLLTSILGFADLAAMELAAGAPARDYLQQITTSGRRGAELTTQLLAYSGRGKFVIRSLSLSQVVREMSHLLAISVGKRSLLKYRLAEKLPLIEADANQMRQAILNLVVNASEAVADRDGVVVLSTGAQECDRAYLTGMYLEDNLREGTYVYLEVEDSGCGMTPDTLSRIFEPFFTTKAVGRGVGLAAVMGIARGHGGGLKVTSDPGRGSRFRLLFPVASAPAAPVKPALETGWSGSGAILLVEDEPPVRDVARMFLQKLGFEVLAVANGFEAMEVFRARMAEIRLVLLDSTMPRWDGEQVFFEITRIRADVPVILTGGHAEPEMLQRLQRKGLAGFVRKPFELEELSRTLRQVLEGADKPGATPA